MNCDCLVLGAGVVGLSLAYELAGHGLRVCAIDRGMPGQEASWAGAGILPPARWCDDDSPLEQLAALSFELHSRWAVQLREETGVDNGHQRCGGIYLARSAEEEAAIVVAARDWRQHGIEVDSLDRMTIASRESALEAIAAGNTLCGAYFLPEESQLRNPRHLKALSAACQRRGVTILPGLAADGFQIERGRITGVRTAQGTLSANTYCVTTGAWTQSLLVGLGVSVSVRPIRGQIVLLNCLAPVLRRVVNEGRRYLVPRSDGRVLVGSTEEEAGYDKRTTSAAVSNLLQFALELVPALRDAQVERCWSGLRPGTADGLPYLGCVPGVSNAFVAAGHFRSGLYLSPGTAVVIGQLIRGEKPQIDLTPFRLDRG